MGRVEESVESNRQESDVFVAQGVYQYVRALTRGVPAVDAHKSTRTNRDHVSDSET